jgi:outer membrane receptor protein involved in Fe transport
MELAGAPVAAAQQAPAAGPDSAAATTLQEVVVTAQKRAERVQDVPASVAVLGGDALLSQSADKLEDYVARVPGLSMNARGLGQQQLSIRGISTGPQYAATVATYVDEAPVGASNGDGAGGLITPDIDSIDLARIEVLRGPQGTLYGASNVGGLLKYVTVAPDPSRFDAVVSGEGDTLAHGGAGYALKARVNVPLVPNEAALLVSGYDRLDPGFISDDGRGAREVDATRTRGARIAFLATPTENLSIKAAAIGQNRNADGFAAVDADPLTLASAYGDYQQRRVPGSEFYRTEVRLYYLTVNYDLKWAQFTETTSYNTVRTTSSQDYTLDFGGGIFGPPYDAPDLGFAAAYDIRQNKLTEEARLSGTAGSIEWVVGAFYTHENSDTVVTVPTINTLTGAPVVLPSLLDADTRAHYLGTAGFGQLTYHVTPKLALTLGGRYAHDDGQSVASSSGALVGPPSATPASASDNATTFTIAPSYKLTDGLTAYARVASGFRPGGANGGFAPAPTYGPDHVKNYEAGLKGDFLAHHLTFELDAFHVDWTGVQLQLRTDTGLGYTADAGEARSDGFEANVAYVPLNGLTLRASATYVDAQLERDIVSGSNVGTKGDPLPYSPPWKVALSGDYTRPINGNWEAFVGASFFYTGHVSAEFQTDPTVPRMQFPSYSTTDARLGVSCQEWTVSLIGKNLFDKRGFNGQTPLTLSAAGVTALSIIQPRALLVSATYNY